MFNTGIVSQQTIISFISTWNTANTSTGSSSSTQIKLPLIATGTYNFNVQWGDGTSDVITSHNQAAVTHTYSAAGTYTLTISGEITGWQFNNSGDRLKITNISKWGNLRLGTQGSYFSGASNLTITATDILDTSLMTSLYGTFNGCQAITTIPSINLWDISNNTSLNSTFRDATNFNSNISNWDTSKVTDMTNMFIRAHNFNQNIGGWNTSSVTTMQNAFGSALSFNQNLGNWNITNITNLSSMFTNVTLSTANYNALLIGWEAQAVKNNLTFNGGNSKYSAGAAETARANLIADHTWTIIDGGLA